MLMHPFPPLSKGGTTVCPSEGQCTETGPYATAPRTLSCEEPCGPTQEDRGDQDAWTCGHCGVARGRGVTCGWQKTWLERETSRAAALGLEERLAGTRSEEGMTAGALALHSASLREVPNGLGTTIHNGTWWANTKHHLDSDTEGDTKFSKRFSDLMGRRRMAMDCGKDCGTTGSGDSVLG